MQSKVRYRRNSLCPYANSIFKERSPSFLTRRNPPSTLLYCACLRMVQYDNRFAQLYAYLQSRKDNPLTKMQALGVLMNKLLPIWWALIQIQTFYNPSFGESV
jgi:hypothetical protein